MGDTGNSSASGGSSNLSGLNLDQIFNDASLGNALSGGAGDVFSGATSSADLSSLFADAGLGSALLGDSSGLGGAFSTATDPSGSTAASLAATPPAAAAGTPSGSDPSGNIGGVQSGGVSQPNAPQPQPTPPATQQKQPESPLAAIAKALRSSFGLGDRPTAGGPTGPTKLEPPTIEGELASPIEGLPPPGDPSTLIPPIARGRGFLGGIPGAIYNTMRATPAETGELTPGQRGMNYRPEDDPQAPGRPQGAEDPTITAGGPGAGAAQPSAPAPTVADAPLPPSQPSQGDPPTASTPDANLPTRKQPETAPEPSTGVYGPTGGASGIGEILRDILGLTLSSPMTLPLLAMALGIGGMGRHRGGLPPWAYHGMTPFMRGRGRGFGGFRGGFLRPGYYPRRQGGWGFHPGGYHPGWGAWAPGMIGNQPMAFAGGGMGGGGQPGAWAGANTQSGGIPNSNAGDAGSTDATGVAHSSNPFLARLLNLESGGQNIVSRTDKDDRGLTLAQGGNQDQISQGYFQIRPSTWRTYAAQAGVNPNILPRQASYADQWKVASVIPFAQWGDRTRVALGLGNIDPRTTLGQVASRYGGTQIAGGGATPSSTTSRQPGFRIIDRDNPSGLTSQTYPAPTETQGAPPVQSDDFAEAG